MNSTPAAASTSNANAKNHTPFTHSFKIPSQSHRNYLTPASNADHSFYQSQPCHLPPPQTPLSHSTFPTSQFTPFSGLRNYTSDDEDEEQDEQDQNMDTEPVPFSWNGHPFKDESLLRRSQRSSMDGTQNLLKSLHSKLSFRPSTPMDPFSNVSEVVNPCAEPSQNPIFYNSPTDNMLSPCSKKLNRKSAFRKLPILNLAPIFAKTQSQEPEYIPSNLSYVTSNVEESPSFSPSTTSSSSFSFSSSPFIPNTPLHGSFPK